MTRALKYWINLLEAIITHQKLLLTSRELPTVALALAPCENQKELLTSGVVFAVNRYEGFMEIKSMIRTFCGCKPSTFWINYKIHKISKNKKVNNLWQKLSEHQNMKFIN